MTDRFADFSPSPTSPGRRAAVVTPGASDLAETAKALLVLAAGNVTVVPLDNDDADTLTFTGLGAGQVIPLRIRRVTAATATVAAMLD